jgi:hypothetical protein
VDLLEDELKEFEKNYKKTAKLLKKFRCLALDDLICQF